MAEEKKIASTISLHGKFTPSLHPLARNRSFLNDLDLELKGKIIDFLNISAVLSWLVTNKEMAQLLVTEADHLLTKDMQQYISWIWQLLAQRIFCKAISDSINTSALFKSVLKSFFTGHNPHSLLYLAMLNESQLKIEQKFASFARCTSDISTVEEKKMSPAPARNALRATCYQGKADALKTKPIDLSHLLRVFSIKKKKFLQGMFFGKITQEIQNSGEDEKLCQSNMAYFSLILEQKEAGGYLSIILNRLWGDDLIQILEDLAEDGDVNAFEIAIEQMRQKKQENQQRRAAIIAGGVNEFEEVNLLEEASLEENFFTLGMGNSIAVAVQFGHIKFLKWLREQLFDDGYSMEQFQGIIAPYELLLLAINSRQLSVVKLLIRRWGFTQHVRYLISKNGASYPVSLLYFSVLARNTLATEFFLKTLQPSDIGIEEIMEAIPLNNFPIVQLLLERLRWLYLLDHPNANQQMLTSHIHRKRELYDNRSPLSLALRCLNPHNYASQQIIEILLKGGGTLASQDMELIRPFVVEAIKQKNLSMVRSVVSKEFYVHARLDGRDQTMLHLAATEGALAIVKFLITRGASPDRRNIHNRTALGVAIRGGHLDVVKYLLTVGCNVNDTYTISSRGFFAKTETPVSLAAQLGYCEILELLLSTGGTSNICYDSEGRRMSLSPIQIALEYRQYKAARILLKRYLKSSTAAEKKAVKVLLHFLSNGWSLQTLPRKHRQSLCANKFLRRLYRFVVDLTTGQEVALLDMDGMLKSEYGYPSMPPHPLTEAKEYKLGSCAWVHQQLSNLPAPRLLPLCQLAIRRAAERENKTTPFPLAQSLTVAITPPMMSSSSTPEEHPLPNYSPF